MLIVIIYDKNYGSAVRKKGLEVVGGRHLTLIGRHWHCVVCESCQVAFRYRE